MTVDFVPFSKDELFKMGKGDQVEMAVKFPKDKGGEYAGMPEVFHLLHCVVSSKLASNSIFLLFTYQSLGLLTEKHPLRLLCRHLSSFSRWAWCGANTSW
jgi:hypothetical protein